MAIIASELKAIDLGSHRHVKVLIQHGPERSNGDIQSSALDDLLSETINSGSIRSSSRAGQIYPVGGPDEYGWFREEFIVMLRRLNFPCPDTLQNPSDTPPVAPDSTPPEADALDEIARLKTEIARLENLRQTEMAEMCEKLAAANDMPDVSGIERERDEAWQEVERLKELVPPRGEFLIPIVVKVQKQFWVDWDESKPRPKAVEEIQPWIRENFPQIGDSNALIQAVEKVACPFDRNPSAKK
ncbi:hypothetical protein [Paraburkholderia denitrificans]